MSPVLRLARGFPAALLLPLLLLLLLALAQPGAACYPSGTAAKTVVIGEVTYVCIFINDRYVGVAKPVADTFTRLVVSGSANATFDNACSTFPFWYPLGCVSGLPNALGGMPQTNYYVSSLGVGVNYKKIYAVQDGISTDWVFPVTTAVISVSNGVVQSVFWDDGCYFCPSESASKDAACPGGQAGCQQCQFNAYNLTTNDLANVNATDPQTGSDCAVVTSSCTTAPKGQSTALPAGFCDLGVYIVWTGTDANGVSFSSSGQRFRRFRQYGMQTQLAAMQFWSPQGNQVSGATGAGTAGDTDAVDIQVTFAPS
jgi:hypothetical protein